MVMSRPRSRILSAMAIDLSAALHNSCGISLPDSTSAWWFRLWMLSQAAESDLTIYKLACPAAVSSSVESCC